MDAWIRYIRANIIYAALLVLLIAAGVASLHFLAGRLRGLPELWQTVQVREEQKDILKNKHSLLVGVTDNELQTLFTHSIEAVPPDKDVGGILIALATLTGRHDVSVRQTSLTPGLVSTQSAEPQFATDETLTENLEGLRFSTTISGELEDIIAFLRDMHQVRRLFGVETVELSFDQDKIEVRLVALAYYSPSRPVLLETDNRLDAIPDAQSTALEQVAAYEHVSVLSGEDNDQNSSGRFDFFQPTQTPASLQEASPPAAPAN